MNLRPAIRLLTRPTVVLPVLLAAALLIFAFKLGGLGSVLLRVQAIPLSILVIALVFTIIYLVIKAVQLRLMLANLGLQLAWRPFALAFSVGELTVTLPLGLFAQNWVLQSSSRIRLGRSSAATVVMLLAEIAVVFLLLAVVGIPGWPELRIISVLVLIVFALLLFGLLRFEHLAFRLAHKVTRPKLHSALLEGIELLRGLKRLSRPRLLAINVLLAAAYLGALIFAFFAVGHGMGLHALSYLTAATIYAFSLAVILVGGGLFSQIGTVEVLGMVAARAWGIDYNNGLALMLGFRLVWTGTMWLLNLPVVILLWRSIRPPAETRVTKSLSEHR